MIKNLLIATLLISSSFSIAQNKIPVKYDSLKELRFNNVVIYRKNKVGVYNTELKKFHVKMTTGKSFFYKGHGEFDGLELFTKNLHFNYFFTDSSLTSASIEANGNSGDNKLLIPSYKNAYFLVDTISKDIVLHYYDPIMNEMNSVSSNQFLHMSVTYDVVQKNNQYGHNGTIRSNNFYAKDSCFKRTYGAFSSFDVDKTQMYYGDELKLTVFTQDKSEYFGMTLFENQIIVHDYNPFSQKINEVNYPDWANSGVYQIEKLKWVKPFQCVNIIPSKSGGYIYNTNERFFNHYTLDSLGNNRASLEVYFNDNRKQINEDLILGGDWGKVDYLDLNSNKSNSTHYFLCAENEKVTIFQMKFYQNFLPHYPEYSTADFMTVSPTHSLIIAINNDSLHLNFQNNVDVFVPVASDSFDLFFPYFNSTKSDYEFYDLLNDTVPAHYQHLIKEPYLQITKTGKSIIVNIPFIINGRVPGKNYSNNTSYVITTFFETQESAVFINEGTGYFPVNGFHSSITTYTFGHLLRTGTYLSKTDSDQDLKGALSEYPLGSKPPSFQLIDIEGNPIMVYKQKQFSQVIDLGFGFQVYINGKSFFMNYTGKIITQPIYHEFKVEKEILIGTIYNDVNSRNKTVLRKDAFAQF